MDTLILPLSILLGFCEDYERMIVNARHELILILMRNGNWLVRVLSNDGIDNKIIQSVVANASCYVKRIQITIYIASREEWMISEY